MLAESQSIRLTPHTTLILKGPASARVLEGRAEAFGCGLGPRDRVVVKPWRSLPLCSEEGCVVEVLLGAGGSAELVEGCTIPVEWVEIVEKLGTNFRAMVIGGVDTGKTSFLTYVFNRLVNGGRIAVADLDVGQSEVCPPTTMGLAVGSSPTPYLSTLKPDVIIPLGYTSPSFSLRQSLKTAGEIAVGALRFSRVLINTDGWIDHEKAREYKSMLIKAFKPSHVIFTGVTDYGDMREASTEVGAEIIELREPKQVLKRDMEARRQIREMNYVRFFRGARLISTPRRWLRITPLLFSSLTVEDYLRTLIREIEDAAVERAPLIEGLDLSGAEMGVLSYVNSQVRRVQSLALFMGIDSKGLARIYTPHQGPIQELEVGAMVLSTSFREVFTFLPSKE